METLVVVAHHKNQFQSRSKPRDHAQFGSSSPSGHFRGINCRTFQTGTGILPTPLKSYVSPVTKRPSPSSSLKTPSPSSSLKTPSPSSSLKTPSPSSSLKTPSPSSSLKTPSPSSSLKIPSPSSSLKTPSPSSSLDTLSSSSYLRTPSPSSSLKTSSPPPNTKSNNTCSKITTPLSTPVPINGKSCEKERTFSEDVPGEIMLLSELWAGPTYSNSPPPSSLPIPKFSVRPKRTVSLDLPGSSPEFEKHPVAKSAPSSPRREHSPSTRDIFANADSATKTLCRILNLNLDDE